MTANILLAREIYKKKDEVSYVKTHGALIVLKSGLFLITVLTLLQNTDDILVYNFDANNDQLYSNQPRINAYHDS